MNIKNLAKSLILVLSIVVLTGLTGFFFNIHFHTILLLDQPSIGYFWSALGTLFSLIISFTLINVWNQFETFSQTLTNESNAIISLMNYSRFLKDEKTLKRICIVLDSYCTKVLNKELYLLSKEKQIDFESKEVSELLEIVDEIKFDDSRDPVSFRFILDAITQIIESRKTLIQLSSVRIPPHLKVFSIIISFGFVSSYLFHGFNNEALYLTTLCFLAFIVAFSQVIVFDLDNYFNGIWNVNYEELIEARRYVRRVGNLSNFGSVD